MAASERSGSLPAVQTGLSADLKLETISGHAHTLGEWLVAHEWIVAALPVLLLTELTARNTAPR